MTPLQEELVAAVFDGDDARRDRILRAMDGRQRLHSILAMYEFVKLFGRLRLPQPSPRLP